MRRDLANLSHELDRLAGRAVRKRDPCNVHAGCDERLEDLRAARGRPDRATIWSGGALGEAPGMSDDVVEKWERNEASTRLRTGRLLGTFHHISMPDAQSIASLAGGPARILDPAA